MKKTNKTSEHTTNRRTFDPFDRNIWREGESFGDAFKRSRGNDRKRFRVAEDAQVALFSMTRADLGTQMHRDLLDWHRRTSALLQKSAEATLYKIYGPNGEYEYLYGRKGEPMSPDGYGWVEFDDDGNVVRHHRQAENKQ